VAFKSFRSGGVMLRAGESPPLEKTMADAHFGVLTGPLMPGPRVLISSFQNERFRLGSLASVLAVVVIALVGLVFPRLRSPSCSITAQNIIDWRILETMGAYQCLDPRYRCGFALGASWTLADC
jgi:hypothetical protein